MSWNKVTKTKNFNSNNLVHVINNLISSKCLEVLPQDITINSENNQN